MKKTEVKGKDFFADVYEDVSLSAFSGLRKPYKSCVIDVGKTLEEEKSPHNNPESMYSFDCDMDFCKKPHKEAERMYDAIVEYHVNGVKNSDSSIYYDNYALIGFGLYKISDDQSLVVAADSDGSVWGIGFFTENWGPFKVNGETFDIGEYGVNVISVSHASVDKCIEENNEFFDDETVKAIFLDYEILKYQVWNDNLENKVEKIKQWDKESLHIFMNELQREASSFEKSDYIVEMYEEKIEFLQKYCI